MTNPKLLSCTCPKCVRACEAHPGWMTPDEALAALNAGMAMRLMRDWWVRDDDERGNISVLCPGSGGYEVRDAPDVPFTALFGGWQRGRCTFLKDGRCEIHHSGFKPHECRGALLCSDEPDDDDIEHEAIAKLWDTDRGRLVVEQWQQAVGY